MSWVETILAILGAMGGLEFVKWLFTRKQKARVAEADADSAEFEAYRKQIDYANERLTMKDQWIADKDRQLTEKDTRYHTLSEKYHDQTLVLRETTAKLLSKEEECGNYKAQISELLAERAMKLCERRGCKDRQPQSGY